MGREVGGREGGKGRRWQGGRERNGRDNIEKEKAGENNSKMLKMRKEEEEWRKDGERDMRIDE